ncbi:hypothetical protein CB1_000595079 [Camelus ferus]|nr:hypothetical protein CB1_000595079 [Camelus ferus]
MIGTTGVERGDVVGDSCTKDKELDIKRSISIFTNPQEPPQGSRSHASDPSFVHSSDQPSQGSATAGCKKSPALRCQSPEMMLHRTGLGCMNRSERTRMEVWSLTLTVAALATNATASNV